MTDRSPPHLHQDDMGLETVIEDPLWTDAIHDPVALAADCHAAAVSLAPQLDGSAALLFADDEALQELNTKFRDRPTATNVLAFPSGEDAPGFLGDIALARETCLKEAVALGKLPRDHAAHLIVHGLLHLIGLDHQTDAEAAEMEAMETAILARMGLAAPYTDNLGDDRADVSADGGSTDDERVDGGSNR